MARGPLRLPHGNALRIPATEALPVFAVTVENGAILVGERRS